MLSRIGADRRRGRRARRCPPRSTTAWGVTTCRSALTRCRASEPRSSTPVAYEALRIEPAIPRTGVDIDETTIPQEAFLERDAVSFTKGCFLGQELVCRIDTRGHVNRFLRRLADIEGDWPPRRRRGRGRRQGRRHAHERGAAPSCRPRVALGYGAARGGAAGRGRAPLGRRRSPGRRRRQSEVSGDGHHEAGAAGVDGLDTRRRRPSPRELAHDGEADAGADACGPARSRDV